MHKAKANKNLEAKGQESPCTLVINSPANYLHILCARPGPMAHSLSLISRKRIFRLQGLQEIGTVPGALRNGEEKVF